MYTLYREKEMIVGERGLRLTKLRRRIHAIYKRRTPRGKMLMPHLRACLEVYT